MMIQGTDEETKLFDELEQTNDPDRKKEIRKRLSEIWKEQEKDYENCPFVH